MYELRYTSVGLGVAGLSESSEQWHGLLALLHLFVGVPMVGGNKITVRNFCLRWKLDMGYLKQAEKRWLYFWFLIVGCWHYVCFEFWNGSITFWFIIQDLVLNFSSFYSVKVLILLIEILVGKGDIAPSLMIGVWCKRVMKCFGMVSLCTQSSMKNYVFITFDRIVSLM